MQHNPDDTGRFPSQSDYTVRVVVYDEDGLGDDDYVDTLSETVHLDPEGVVKLFTISGRTE